MDISLDFLSNTADGAMAVDLEQKIIFWNEAAEQLLGFTAEDVLGRFCHEVISGCDRAGRTICHKSCLIEMQDLERGAVRALDFKVLTKTGQTVWLNVSTMLVLSTRQELSALVHLFRNVTHQKELEESAQQLVTTVSKLSFEEEKNRELNKPLLVSSPKLTRREREVLGFLVSGCTTMEISKNLHITPATVRNHIHNLLAKLGVRSRLEAATLAIKTDLI